MSVWRRTRAPSAAPPIPPQRRRERERGQRPADEGGVARHAARRHEPQRHGAGEGDKRDAAEDPREREQSDRPGHQPRVDEPGPGLPRRTLLGRHDDQHQQAHDDGGEHQPGGGAPADGGDQGERDDRAQRHPNRAPRREEADRQTGVPPARRPCDARADGVEGGGAEPAHEEQAPQHGRRRRHPH